jgi:hypothetical protein
MENQPTTSKKSIMLNYGILLGFASIIVALVNYVIGNIYEPHWSLIVVSLVVTSAILVLGIKKIKEGNEGLLTLGEAIKAGLGISLVSALIYCVYLFIFYSFIEPEFFDNMLKVQEQVMLEKYPNMSDEQLEGAKKGAAAFANTGVNIGMTIFMSLFFGLIISLIAGLIMKKTNEE